MGYNIHITRKDEYFDEDGDEISIEEWKEYISKDHEMRLDGFAEANTPGGILRVESEGLAVWTKWSKHDIDGGMAWMDHSEGNITVKNPDNEVLVKMFSIAVALHAKVQGDEGEMYNSNGESNWQELKAEGQKQRVAVSKKWWQFWR